MNEVEGEGGANAANGEAGRKRRKLHGRAFYESIGSPRLVLAPMVEQSEFVRLHIHIGCPQSYFITPHTQRKR